MPRRIYALAGSISGGERGVHRSFVGQRTLLRMTRLVEAESVYCGHATVFLQPLQLFSYFDFAVPGILAEAVAFAGED